MNAAKINRLSSDLQATERLYNNLKDEKQPWQIRIHDHWFPEIVSEKLGKAIWAAIDDSTIELREEIRKAVGR